MDQPALQVAMETVVDAVTFDGDAAALASQAQMGVEMVRTATDETKASHHGGQS